MANENQNIGPTPPGSSEEARRSLDFTKEALRVQGDYKNLLKESETLLRRMSSSYDSIEGRLESLSKGSINLKQINQEILKAKQKEYIVGKKLEETAINVNAKNNDGIQEYLRSLEHLNIAREEDRDMLEEISRDLFRNLNTEEQRYVNLVEANNLNKKAVAYAQQKLEAEKRANASIGITGKLMGMIGKKLGANNDVYEDMVENAKELEKAGGKLTFLDKLKFLGKSVGSGLKETITDPLTAIPLIGTAIGGLIKGLKSVLDFILDIQDKTVKFARAMNLSTGQAREIKKEFASLSISSGDLFINSQKMVESQMEFVDALGVTNRFTNEQLATNIKLKDITGLDLETRQGIVEASTITGKSSENITKSVLAQVTGLKQATGVSFQYQRILKEASNLGGYLGLSFAKYPAQLTKSLLTVKAMGMELKQVDSLADSFLDFESSISKEFEAQLLTGKEINLTKAREAFLNNDLATAASEITRQVGSAGDFLKLNRIQAESLASAFGMSRDQMGEMLKRQELLSKLGAKDTDNAQKQLQLGLQRYKTQEALTAAVGEEAYQSLVNASMQEKIGAFMEKIKQSIADFVEKSGIIEKLEGFFNYLSEPGNVRAIIIKIRDIFAQVVDIVATIASGVVGVLDFFGAISDEKADSIQAFLEGTGDSIRSLGGDFGGVSVKEGSAKKEVGSTKIASQDESKKMAMPPQEIIINQNFSGVQISDSNKNLSTRSSVQPLMDHRGGKV